MFASLGTGFRSIDTILMERGMSHLITAPVSCVSVMRGMTRSLNCCLYLMAGFWWEDFFIAMEKSRGSEWLACSRRGNWIQRLMLDRP